MNYLAHLYLSENNQIRIGNFISDFVKGKNYQNYPTDIQRGILIHRKIDSFTDSHPIFIKSKRRLDKRYNLYSGIVIDLFYDHFLANNWSRYSKEPLADFIQNSYSIIGENIEELPEKVQYLFPFMVKQNWLYKYKTIEGMGDILRGMDSRTKMKSGMQYAVNDLRDNYKDFESDFFIFFAELEEYIKTITLNQYNII
ncbi:MAG: DUF479 domain-containing protein [Flavobacteriaceae bacterium]|nr:DUF479 domain-containing protein [Flavobacteriaceae bacterium]